MSETKLRFSPMDREAAAEILNWHYPPPYDFYDLAPAPDERESEIAFMCSPENAYFRIDDAEDQLVAFCCFGGEARVPGGDYSEPALDLGLGVRPDLTGRGCARYYVGALIQFGLEKYSPNKLRVTIATFNGRARRVWEREGFQTTQRFAHRVSGAPFVIMERAT